MMTINRRRVMGKTGGPILPDGYKLLQYVSNSSDAFVLLPLHADNNTVIETELYNYTDTTYIIGTRSGQRTGGYFAIGLITENVYFFFNAHNNAEHLPYANNQYIYIKAGNGVFQVGDTTITYSTSAFASVNPFTLFRCCNNANGDGVGNIYYTGGIGKTKILTSGQEYDLYPCETGEGVAGFYDITNRIFYGSENNTPLVSGPIITQRL